MKPVRFDPEAEDELFAANRWYEARKTGLGDDLIAMVDHAVARIQRHPRAFGLVAGIPRTLHVRRARLARFPFAVVFIELDEEIRVLALAHERRRPGYWRHRVRRRKH